MNADMRDESSAGWCKRKGYGPGTRLKGAEVYSDGSWRADTITITAVGKWEVLAIADGRNYENLWTLEYRDWKPAEDWTPPDIPKGVYR